jgi:hypothetical protein
LSTTGIIPESNAVQSRFLDAKVPHDELTLSRQRSVFLLNPEVVNEQAERRQRLHSVRKERRNKKAQKARAELKSTKKNPSGNQKRPRQDPAVIRNDPQEEPLDEEEADEAQFLQNIARRRRPN